MTDTTRYEEKQIWTVRDVVRWMSDRFAREGIESARLDAELLCAQVLECDRVGIYLAMDRPLSIDERVKLRELVQKRLARFPVAYLIGKREFFGLTLHITPAVLVPRPDTETLVEAALELFSDSTPIDVLDVGTGSGAIAIAIAVNRPLWRVTATDISREALDVARKNAQKHQVNIEFLQGDLLSPVTGRRFHLIVSNPPYIPQREILQPEVQHEPSLALFSGTEGLNHLQRILQDAPHFLHAQGLLLCEFGTGQESQLKAMAQTVNMYRDIRILRDLGNRPRVFSAKIAHPFKS